MVTRRKQQKRTHNSLGEVGDRSLPAWLATIFPGSVEKTLRDLLSENRKTVKRNSADFLANLPQLITADDIAPIDAVYLKVVYCLPWRSRVWNMTARPAYLRKDGRH